jgi:hypothetical protein
MILDMNWLRSMVALVVVGSSTSIALGQLTIVTNLETQRAFSGHAKDITVMIHNDGGNLFAGEIGGQMFQTSSTTAVPIGEVAWKKIQVLPRQTVLETAQLDFSAVQAETKFLVQWLENSNRVIGTTEVWVYPTNLLAELKPLLGEAILGVLDPNHELAPVLKLNGVKFVDLGRTTLEDFSGQLAILGPFHSNARMSDELAQQIKVLAKRNAAVIWLVPPPDRQDALLPSFYTVMEGTNAVVVAQADMVSKLSENPQSQLHLIHFCKLALKPEPPGLPHLTIQP